MAQGVSYPEEFVDRLESIWGAGFLTPGGPDEVREILRGLDTADKTLLDIGCGVAGPATLIARELGAHRIVGVDIEPQLIERGRRNLAAAGLENKVELQLVEPGPLPFDDASFDVVFSKDALVHVEDKPAIYREILRVLRPGGRFAASDWLVSEDAEELPAFVRYRALTHLRFTMQTAAQTERVMREAGFVEVSTRDRNASYVATAQRELELLDGPLRERLLEVCDEETYRHTVSVRRANTEAAACGGLRPNHLRGTRPSTA